MTVYKRDNQLIHDTGVSPRQFKGVLTIVYCGDTPETVGECAIGVNELKGLEKVPISQLSVPWRKALRLPEPAVASKPTAQDSTRTNIGEESSPEYNWRQDLKDELWDWWDDGLLTLILLPWVLMGTTLVLLSGLSFWIEERWEMKSRTC